MKYNPHPYQDFGREHIINNPYSGLFMEMGLGKTVVTMTAIDELMYDRLEVSKVLVIAPKRVAEETWSTERDKWEHLKHLRIAKMLGTPKQRIDALHSKADIYIINRENIVWLIQYLKGGWPFPMVVVDELSSFKSTKSLRFKALKAVRPRIKRLVGLTGTPAPNSLLDLWPQMYLLDMGERLGKTVTQYREQYFNAVNKGTHIDYSLKKDGDDLIGKDYYAQRIYEKISDICVSMKTKDYLTLPPRLDQDVLITLPRDIMQKYQDFEEAQVIAMYTEHLRQLEAKGELALASGNPIESISAANAAALQNKLLQFANGALYNEQRQYYEIHNEKIEALTEDVEAANGNPFLCFYQYQHDLDRIMKHLKHLKPYKLGTGKNDLDKWNKGQIPFMLAHAASAGHGLNMQYGGHLMGWFGLTWSLELYLQAVARLDRQGQKFPVINRRYLARGTYDEKVLRSIDMKGVGQDNLMNAIKALVKKYVG